MGEQATKGKIFGLKDKKDSMFLLLKTLTVLELIRSTL